MRNERELEEVQEMFLKLIDTLLPDDPRIHTSTAITTTLFWVLEPTESDQLMLDYLNE